MYIFFHFWGLVQDSCQNKKLNKGERKEVEIRLGKGAPWQNTTKPSPSPKAKQRICKEVPLLLPQSRAYSLSSSKTKERKDLGAERVGDAKGKQDPGMAFLFAHSAPCPEHRGCKTAASEGTRFVAIIALSVNSEDCWMPTRKCPPRLTITLNHNSGIPKNE